MSTHASSWTRWLPSVATVLSIAACYGTLAVVGTLGAMGIALAVDDALWAGAIVAFAMLAVVGIAVGLRAHHRPWPLLLGAIGAGAITYTMYFNYDRAIELSGFALLSAAAVWDWRLRRLRGV